VTIVGRDRLRDALRREQARFVQTHPRSLALFERAQAHLLGGVPMNWMVRWAGPAPIFVSEGQGAHLSDVDGHRYLDLCLGDTGAMLGHAPAAVVQAIAERAGRGCAFMLPTEDALWVGQELARRFGMPYWQFALTATDANRFAIRVARAITGRPLICVFNWSYHGTVDEAFITLDGRIPQPRRGNLGMPVHPSLTTRVIEFNDIDALQAALAPGDAACVLAEPVMTNIGIVHPESGYHDALREITRRTGTLLIIDETHTICCGIGGYTREHGLQPDLLTIGKPIGGGVPAAAYGMSADVAERLSALASIDDADTSGIGGTLAGNALSMAAVRAMLQHVLTDAAFVRTIPLARRWVEGVQAAITEFDLPWHVTQLGCRAEYWFIDHLPSNGGEAASRVDPELDRYMHLAALNRGILLTPFHNMALIAPEVSEADIDLHTRVFRDSVVQIAG
jgi:glutamate-1-semialdehyde 2,1-aminomutase